MEAGNELLAAAEAALQSMGTRLRALEEGRAEGDAGAEAGLRAKLAFFQAELEAEMKVGPAMSRCHFRGQGERTGPPDALHVCIFMASWQL